MSTKLNQIIAIEKGVKNQAHRIETELYQSLAKTVLFSGLSRTYRPKDEDDRDLQPPESTSVQLKGEELIKQLIGSLTRFIDVTATKDATNTLAKADVVIDGVTLAAGVPVPTLIFFEKEIVKLEAFVKSIPQLDPAKNWAYDANVGVHRADAVETTRTKKLPRNHELSPATDKHPAQVQVFTEDVLVGYWTKIDFSGALPADRIAAIQDRLDRLKTAVKYAREEANNTEVVDVHYADSLLHYVFDGGDTTP